MVQMKYHLNGYFNFQSGLSYIEQFGEQMYNWGKHKFDIPTKKLKEEDFIFKPKDWIKSDTEESEDERVSIDEEEDTEINSDEYSSDSDTEGTKTD